MQNETKLPDNRELRLLKKQYEILQVEIDTREKEPDTPHLELDSFMRTQTLQTLEQKRQELEKSIREAVALVFPYRISNILSENPRVMIFQLGGLLGPEPAAVQEHREFNPAR